MNKVLFEVSYIGSPSGFFYIMLFISLWTIGLIYEVKKKHSTNDKKEYLFYKIDYFGTVFFAIVYFVIMFGLIITYGDVVIGYKLGKYCEVEGVVENYTKAKYVETFTVDNVEFKTSGVEMAWGYVWPLNKHSVIIGNGQHLKIRYIPNTKSIVYIEEIIDG